MKYYLSAIFFSILASSFLVKIAVAEPVNPVFVSYPPDKEEMVTIELFQKLNKLYNTVWLGLEWARPIQSDKIIYILAGKDALIAYLGNNISTPAVAVLISSPEYNEIIEHYTDRNVTAIFANPKPESQLEIAKELLPQPDKKFAILVKDSSKHLSLVEFAKSIDLHVELIPVGDSVIKTLGKISEYHGLIALYDTGIYSSDIMQTVIRSMVRRNIALIGYSRPMVIAGALASPYSTLESIAKDIGDTINYYLLHKKLPSPQYPRNYLTKINKPVALTLGIKVPLGIARSFQ